MLRFSRMRLATGLSTIRPMPAGTFSLGAVACNDRPSDCGQSWQVDPSPGAGRTMTSTGGGAWADNEKGVPVSRNPFILKCTQEESNP